MSEEGLIGLAGERIIGLVRRIRPYQLGSPTPCSDFDVRHLVNHLLFWGPSLEAAARKESVLPPAESESEIDLTNADWCSDLAAQLQRTTSAWSRPAAWQGSTQMGGPDQLSAALIGGMVTTELVIHGWDLARATGQHSDWSDELLQFVHQEVIRHAEWGRQIGSYGPEVSVPQMRRCSIESSA